jgi:hypothetical protein
MRQYSLSTAFSQWPYTALSDLRIGALMSIIGVVTFAKEPTQTHKGGTSFPLDYLRHSRYFPQTGALASLYWTRLS